LGNIPHGEFRPKVASSRYILIRSVSANSKPHFDHGRLSTETARKQMRTLLSANEIAPLLTLSAEKKLAFLILLNARMIQELQSFCVSHDRDFAIFDSARKLFLEHLNGENPAVSLAQVRNDILKETPDTEDFVGVQTTFALNAGLVAWEIAGFLEDNLDQHLLDAIGYAGDSTDAYAVEEFGAIVIDAAVEAYASSHRFLVREKQREIADIEFLRNLSDDLPRNSLSSTLMSRLRSQGSLFDDQKA
jgi:hypothetical protein